MQNDLNLPLESTYPYCFRQMCQLNGFHRKDHYFVVKYLLDVLVAFISSILSVFAFVAFLCFSPVVTAFYSTLENFVKALGTHMPSIELCICTTPVKAKFESTKRKF